MLVGQLRQTLQQNLIFLRMNREGTSAGSVLLKETDEEDKVQPDFTELSEVLSLPPAPAQLSTF